ncbi:unnamed protein product [Cunninghamella echinulata]
MVVKVLLDGYLLCNNSHYKADDLINEFKRLQVSEALQDKKNPTSTKSTTTTTIEFIKLSITTSRSQSLSIS